MPIEILPTVSEIIFADFFVIDSFLASPPDGSYAKVSRLINKRLRNYDKNVRPNDTGK